MYALKRFLWCAFLFFAAIASGPTFTKGPPPGAPGNASHPTAQVSAALREEPQITRSTATGDEEFSMVSLPARTGPNKGVLDTFEGRSTCTMHDQQILFQSSC